MKRSFFPMMTALVLFTSGCGIKWQVVQDPFPNFHLIERRANFQDQQIGNAVQTGQLARPFAQSLSDNVALIRQFAWGYQNPDGAQTIDLSAPQTRYLGILLNDNQSAINDALTRQSQWANAFQGGWNYNFNYGPDRLLYIAVLHHQLVEQQAMVEDAYSNGSLNSTQVADLRSRIQVIREAEEDDYNQNGSLDLNRDQMQELSEMVDDNYRYLRFRAQFAGDRRWSGDHFGSWGQYKQTFDVRPSTLPVKPTSGNKYWDGRSIRVQGPATHPEASGNQSKLPPPTSSGIFSWTHATPTSIPQAPSPTPIPQAPPTPPQKTGQWDQGPKKDDIDHRPGHDRIEKVQNTNDVQGNDQGAQPDQMDKSIHGQDQGNQDRPQGQQGGMNRQDAQDHPREGKNQEAKSPQEGKTDAIVAGDHGLQKHAEPRPKTEDKVPVWISPDALNKRFNGLMERMDQTRLKGRDRAQLNHERNDFRQSLNRSLQQNKRKSLTQDQVDQLTKMLDGIEKDLPSDGDQ